MRRRSRSVAAAAAVGLGLVLLTPAAAAAHEEREVGGFTFTVGFGNEPAYSGQQNSVQLILSDSNGKPVTDLGPTLEVQVEYQGTTMPPMTMEPNFEVGEFGIPGDYEAFFFPTRPGDYSFHFTGTIDGQPVDETFTSGPETFSPVQDPAAVEFPVKDPTAGELAGAVERLGPRVDRAVAEQQEAAARAEQAGDDASSARTMALVALAVGAILGAAGTLLGTAALRRARTRAA